MLAERIAAWSDASHRQRHERMLRTDCGSSTRAAPTPCGRHPGFMGCQTAVFWSVQAVFLGMGASGLEAAVKDADESIGELAEGGSVADVAGAELLVVGGGAG